MVEAAVDTPGGDDWSIISDIVASKTRHFEEEKPKEKLLKGMLHALGGHKNEIVDSLLIT